MIATTAKTNFRKKKACQPRAILVTVKLLDREMEKKPVISTQESLIASPDKLGREPQQAELMVALKPVRNLALQRILLMLREMKVRQTKSRRMRTERPSHQVWAPVKTLL